MERIKFETAKLLREKGYLETNNPSYILTEWKNCVSSPEHVENSPIGTLIGYYINEEKTVSAPYQEEVIEWLWNKHEIHIEIALRKSHVTKEIMFLSSTYFIKEKTDRDIRLDVTSASIYYESRNEAMEYGIIDALKLIK